MNANEKKYVIEISKDLIDKVKHNKRTVEKMAAHYGITNKNKVKELTELAIVGIARRLAHQSKSIKQRYQDIVGLYNSQVNLSHRTSESVRLQQYSTPAPIAFLAGIYCGVNNHPEHSYYFEPSAGNGLLTVAGYPKDFIVNEVDDIRSENLRQQDYQKVSNKDASQPFNSARHTADAVITNPPFGTLSDGELHDGKRVKVLDHLMAYIALDVMRHDGKAAIIIGGHTKWDERGRIQKGKNREFFLKLYHHYNVEDVINIDGHKLYSRQGTVFNVRLILINGRKVKPEGFPPIQKVTDEGEDTFEGLYERVIQHVDEDIATDKKNGNCHEKRIHIAKVKAKAKIKLLELMKI